jgi:phage terminase large subunit-like protein
VANGGERGLWFDGAAASRAFRFFGLLRFTKGRWGGKPFKLQGWQKFFIGCIFGWKRSDGTRRFREAHLEVARKNGKTELAAGIAAYLAFADGEFGAEVYCLATKRDQARTTFDVSKKLLSGEVFRSELRRLKAQILQESSGSKIEPLGADADTLDSLNVHGVIKDELHAWKSRELWDVMDTATGARSQPLGVVTTTAGHNRRSIWWERRELAVKLLERRDGFDNDEFFPLIYTLDDGDDYRDEATWAKGNPSLGVTVRPEELRARFREAIEQSH